MNEVISRRDFVIVSALGATGLVIGCHSGNNFDIIVRHGVIVDGLGGAPYRSDLGIRKDKIVAMGDLSAAQAKQIIDATGHMVTPGFIDIHTHTDVELLANPRGESKIRQGVTTEVSGNCGTSPFPLSEADRVDMDARWQKRFGVGADWTDLDGFYRRLEASKIGINYATFTGQGDLRGFCVGLNDVPATSDQMSHMERVLAESMEQGSLGLASGLEYTPSSFANTDELVALCKIVAKYGGVYATHMRNEDDTVEEAVAEAIEISRRAGVSTQISHLKACNKNNWHKVPAILEQISKAREILPVDADRYPYTAWGTGLTTFLPIWARQGDTDEVLERLRNPETAQKIKTYAESRAQRIGGWDRVLISSCGGDGNSRFQGKYVSECALESNASPVDFVQTLLLSARNSVEVVGFAMDEDNLKTVLAAPFTMIGSDGNAVAPYGVLGEDIPHPRYYGTFPRVLGRYAREQNVMPMAEAVKRMTSMPAVKLGFKDRGVLKVGHKADIVIFDPKTVIDQATYTKPHQYPVGIDYVLVNGKMVIKQGEHTGELPGQVLRRGI